MIKISIDGKTYLKSSFSSKSYKCVGIRKEAEKIFIINTKTKGPTVEFTFDEWEAFVKGVKAGEFDHLKEAP